ncbi:hypothetical protein M413DRAFT_23462 [Hebeloma cylindrosporum]|uniref:Uncharacterized protein n=1 Tax=Hebeloma cylindrosporum TaxID=76867 RepID=A0A0C2YBL5_HEBCY|nr:hypothetical protein M413DRAFT_23462 [Hebeloma cylindrosporum h7]
MEFSLRRPDTCFAYPWSGVSLFCLVPEFLLAIKTLSFDSANEVYHQKLGEVLDFFVSKLPLYYSSRQLTLLVTLLDIPPYFFRATSILSDTVPLPSRLKTLDSDAFGLHSFFSHADARPNWTIFAHFLDSDHPMALDGQKYATASFVCLKLLFKHYQAPPFQARRPSSWLLGRHSRAHKAHHHQHSGRHHTAAPAEIKDYQSVRFYWHFRTTRMTQKCRNALYSRLLKNVDNDRVRSSHLQFILEKSSHSDDILNFGRRIMFRLAYFSRKHPSYIKEVILALAKYIQRVTGGNG